jgi:hypothetical protein
MIVADALKEAIKPAKANNFFIIIPSTLFSIWDNYNLIQHESKHH